MVYEDGSCSSLNGVRRLALGELHVASELYRRRRGWLPGERRELEDGAARAQSGAKWVAPALAVSDGALGIWAATREVPDTVSSKSFTPKWTISKYRKSTRCAATCARRGCRATGVNRERARFLRAVHCDNSAASRDVRGQV